MRRIALLLVMLFLFSTLAYAGNSIDVDLEGVRSRSIDLFEGDEARFELLGYTHSLIIEEVAPSGDSVKFDIVAYIDGDTEVSAGFVTLDTIMKVDLNRDGVTDLNVALYSVNAEGEANIVMQSVVEGDSEITGDVGLVDSVDGEWKNTALGVIGVLVVIILIVMFFRKKEDKAEEKKEEVVETTKEETKEEEVKEEKVEEEAAEEVKTEKDSTESENEEAPKEQSE